MRVHSKEVELALPEYQTALDISSQQGKINWDKVKQAGIPQVIIKATEGAIFQDVTFLYNWEMANYQGMKTSVYHYFRTSCSKPEQQVKNIIQTLSLTTFNKIEDLLAINVEEQGNQGISPKAVAHNLYCLLKGLEAHNFGNIFIHSNYNYWEHQVSWELFDFSRYPLWLARYVDKFDVQPKLPTTWKNTGWTFWQYSCLGQVGGIDSFVDLNFCKPYKTDF